MEEEEVNEATAKLKGMLGIGGGGGLLSGNPETTSGNQTEVANPGSGKPPQPNKNKKNRNKNKTTSRQRGGRENKGGEQTQQQSRPHSKSPQSHPPKDAGKKGVKGKKNKKNEGTDKIYASNKDTGGNNNPNNKDTTNFAWSKFQSSPDASALPIPAFSPANPKDLIAISDAAAEQHAMSSLLPVSVGTAGSTAVVPTAPGPNLENAPRAEDLENEAIAAAKEKVDEKTGETTEAETEKVPPPSKTGINLAALTSAKSDTGGTGNPSSAKTAGGTAVPSATPSGIPNQQQQQQYYYQQQHAQQMNQHPYQHHHPNPAYHHYPMNQPYHPPPPGYATIHVQVPPTLMPGRQMVVQSPAGYPVQVQVPEGIPPGMVIPVHVPAHPPMHMMPPQQQQQQQQQQRGYQQPQQQQHQQQQQRYYNHPGR